MKTKKWIPILTALIVPLMTGCGGGGGTPANHAPVARAQSIVTDEDTAKTFTLQGSDEDNDTLTYTVVTHPSHGSLGGTAPNLIYTPAADYHGTDSFKFKVNDGTVTSAGASVNITVNRVDDPPTLADSNGSVAENAEAGAAVATVTIVDTGDDPVTSMSLSGSGAANFDVAADGSVTVAAGAMLDYETCTEYNLTVTAASAAGTSNAVHLDINVSDYTNPFQIAKLHASDAEVGDQFGYAVAIDGDYIVVGALYEDTGGTDAGSVYVFKRTSDTNITQIAKLQSGDIEAGDHFGNSVAISGNYIVVGALRESTGGSYAGSAYVFKRNSDTNITQIAKLQSTDKQSNDYFGSSVAIDGDYIVIGAFGEDTGGSSAGSTYVFKRNSDTNITQIAKIQSNDIQAGDYFGSSVAISGDYIVVGAYGEDTGGAYAGSAYVFKRNSDTNITQIAKIQPNDIQAGDYFGMSVAINGDYIVVGALRESPGSYRAGSAYVFKRNSDINITQIAKLQAADAEDNDNFGNEVAVDGDYIVVGALYEDAGGLNAGSVYVFKRNSDTNITQIIKLQSHNVSAGDRFGTAVAISGDYIIAGADGEDTGGSSTGSVYLFDMEPSAGVYLYNAPSSPLGHDEEYPSSSTLIAFDAATPEGDAVYYALGGVDAGAFVMNDNNLSFDPKANYEHPNDDDGNNDYNLTVTASDNNGHEITVAVNISVNDRTYFQISKLQSTDIQADDHFGNAVAIDGDYIVVGAYGGDTGGSSAGSTYVFKRNSDSSLTQIAKLNSNDMQSNDLFGNAVAIDGDYIVVGAYREDTNGSDAGSVYVFKRNSDSNIIQIAKLQSSDIEAGDYFGTSVAIDGDYIVVGAYREDTNGSDAGSVYVFKRNNDSNIIQIAKLQSSDIEAGDHFGTSVSIFGDYILAGSAWEDTGGSRTGSVYVFKRNSDASITQIAKLQSSDIEAGDYFGNSVAIYDHYIVIGALGEDTGGNFAGSAYVFKHNSDTNITQIAKLQSNDIEAGDYFGKTVAIDGDYIVIGAYKEDTNGSDAGSAYVFKRIDDANITQIEHLTASNAGDNDYFGSSVDISGDYIIAGARREDTGGVDAGSAYLFKRDTN